jgi:hypothetical protein
MSLYAEDKTIHVRRHSVIVSSARYGGTQRFQPEGHHDGRHERFRSRDLAYPQSYQSSKEIKSLSKYNYNREVECDY